MSVKRNVNYTNGYAVIDPVSSTMLMILFPPRGEVENIHHIHRYTGSARQDAYTINFVITTIGCCSP
jgi:hypothetical protein